MKFAAFLIVLLTVNFGYSQIKSKPITEFSQNSTKNMVLVDVRTAAEYNAGHLDNAVNIDWYDPQFVNKIKALDQQKTIYLYCKMGGRSAKATAVLDSIGYTAINLSGGYSAFQQNKNKD